jgi:rhamnogalacturonyl hydrolase YesR
LAIGKRDRVSARGWGAGLFTMNRRSVVMLVGAASLVGGPVAQAQPAVAPAAPDPSAITSGRVPTNAPVSMGPMSIARVTEVLNRVRDYLENTTPPKLVDRETGQEITDYSKPNPNAMFARGDFQLVTYEWGVTYSGMLLAGEATGDARFTDYVGRRLKFVTDVLPMFRAQAAAVARGPAAGEAPRTTTAPGRGPSYPLRSVIAPASLDDSGSMCAAMIKAHRAGLGGDLRPLIDNYIDWIGTKQMRLADGTLARNRPMADSLWLDDLYMSVPALAQMGKLTGDRKYYDDAVKQILQFSERMFVREKGLYMHGWVQGMTVHPAFHWARANGWALMAMTELLEVLPADHSGRAAVLDLYRAHVRGLADCQGGDGLWHQLLDRSDSYLETSASAIFVYCFARGINRGWLDPLAHTPMTQLGWNAVAGRVNAKGQVEGTCVGTGMEFQPTFYYYRPTNVLAAHGYGPVLLAGAEYIALQKSRGAGNAPRPN